ncbi:ribonuclease E inhibitor RraB [Psittacicella hinzii]|uniref:Regulator of ribonuclease activity B domain-containing protein n=1 Tax=Psittacicella hinzii TaxID=2028575 RepID=A0A3A1YB66_9GAMM|nr:ribonuclease E inhibitor RraB [Psittacicella hinzii]RIY34781.1 hypothetical protein CKF58_07665 [Psittacicella hinzii]
MNPDLNFISKFLDETIADITAAGTKPELNHIILHHIIFKSDKYIDNFIAEAAKLSFECDEPEFINEELINEEDRVEYPDGYWNLDVAVEVPLTEKEYIIEDISELLNIINKFPEGEVAYGFFGTFIETGEEEDENVEPIYWSV